MWCEGNPVTSNDSELSSAKEAKQSATDGEPLPAKKVKQSVTGTSKRESFEEEIDQIFAELKGKHIAMPAPKLRLWARLIQSVVIMIMIILQTYHLLLAHQLLPANPRRTMLWMP